MRCTENQPAGTRKEACACGDTCQPTPRTPTAHMNQTLGDEGSGARAGCVTVMRVKSDATDLTRLYEEDSKHVLLVGIWGPGAKKDTKDKKDTADKRDTADTKDQHESGTSRPLSTKDKEDTGQRKTTGPPHLTLNPEP